MTHEDEVSRRHKEVALRYRALTNDLEGWMIADEWVKKSQIPLIQIPEVARIIGVKPSEIDPYFEGKNHIVIDWRGER